MIDDFPVPLEFALPNDAWQVVEPAAYGVEAAFLALRSGDNAGYVPTISIAGDMRLDPTPLEAISDEGVARIAAQSIETEVLDRKRLGYEFAPAALQLLRSRVGTDHGETLVRTIHVTLGFEDPEDVRRRAVVTIPFMCAEADFDTFGREFQEFLATLALSDGSDGS